MWLDELNETELHVMETSIRAALANDELSGHTKLNAQQVLSQIEDYLWNNVCLGTPANLDQLQTGR